MMKSDRSHREFLTWRPAVVWFMAFLLLLPSLVVTQPADLPTRLGPLKLSDRMQGQAARSFINRMHDKNITPKNSIMGRYREGNDEASLYVSIYTTQSSAAEASKRMTRLIKAGHRVFSRYKQLTHGKIEVGQCEGLGQTHFFFQHQKRLYWLSADPRCSDVTLQSLLKFVDTAA
ncbi:MAG: hypothetical protein NTU47_08625 [Ignavibacteriales bacterium]|nr:hypothetical protein [Ignavibacteriales bacterium]